jgi:hypothetical protein
VTGESDDGVLRLQVSCTGLVLPFSIFIVVVSILANLYHIGIRSTTCFIVAIEMVW